MFLITYFLPLGEKHLISCEKTRLNAYFPLIVILIGLDSIYCQSWEHRWLNISPVLKSGNFYSVVQYLIGQWVGGIEIRLVKGVGFYPGIKFSPHFH